MLSRLDVSATGTSHQAGESGAGNPEYVAQPERWIDTGLRTAEDRDLCDRWLHRGRRIVYSNPAQRVWLVAEDGRVEYSYAVSGRRGVPAGGTVHQLSRFSHRFVTGGRPLLDSPRTPRTARLHSFRRSIALRGAQARCTTAARSRPGAQKMGVKTHSNPYSRPGRGLLTIQYSPGRTTPPM
mgnify:CR=1 FL=1